MTIRLEKLLTVGEVAQRSGVAVSAIHFYEAKGLIQSIRTTGNQRRYSRDVLRHIAVIKIAQRAGIPLAYLHEIFCTLPADKKINKKEWQRLSTQWKNELNARITALTNLRDDLEQCIGCGCLSLKDCPLRNPGDILSEKGPGAHLIGSS